MRFLSGFILIALSVNVMSDENALQALQQFHQALQEKKGETALNLLSDDAEIFESGYAETKKEYAAHHLAADIDYASATQDKLLHQTMQCDTTMCVIQRQSETTGSYRKKVVHTINMETAVLKNIDGKWRIQHLHWSSCEAH